MVYQKQILFSFKRNKSIHQTKQKLGRSNSKRNKSRNNPNRHKMGNKILSDVQWVSRLESADSKRLPTAKNATKKPIQFTPKVLSENINTLNNEYFPSLTADGEKLYFTRHIKSGGVSQEDIFVSEKDSNGEWGKSFSVSNNINTPSNEGAHSISADGCFLYFTMCEHQGGYGGCDIYVSKRVGSEWSKPEILGDQINTIHKY